MTGKHSRWLPCVGGWRRDGFLHNSLDYCRLLPFNQLAALKLRQAGEAVAADLLPVFQLMRWGLRTGLEATHRRTVREIERLQAEDPAVAFAYLTANLPALERQFLYLPPKAAAERLFDTLEQRLKADPRTPYPGA